MDACMRAADQIRSMVGMLRSSMQLLQYINSVQFTGQDYTGTIVWTFDNQEGII